MKLSTRLLLSYLFMAFLVVLVGAGSWYLNNSIRQKLIIRSQESIDNLQWVSDLEFHLQNSLLFTRNFLYEKNREQESLPSGIQLRSRSAEQEIRDNLERVAESLSRIRSGEGGLTVEGEEHRLIQEGLNRLADSLYTSIDLYRSLIHEMLILDEDPILAEEMLNLTIEPWFRTTLLKQLDEYRGRQNELVRAEMSALQLKAGRDTRIIAILTVTAILLATLLAWGIHHSIARPLWHLAKAAEEIGSGNFGRRIRIGTHDELERLADSFNRMAENLNRSMVSINELKEAEEKLSRSLNEKEVLLAEIHHRVKNNLAVVSGLLEMQVWNLPEGDEAASALKESQLRIHSIALVHELLYQSETLSEIRLDEFIVKLLGAIENAHRKNGTSPAVSTRLQPVQLTIRKAIPVALFLNELVVNGYKHAFPGKEQGEIAIRLYREKGRIGLVVEDNGIGLPPDFDPFEQQTLGMTLVKTLVRQIQADFRVGTPSADGNSQKGEGEGSRFEIMFDPG